MKWIIIGCTFSTACVSERLPGNAPAQSTQRPANGATRRARHNRQAAIREEVFRVTGPEGRDGCSSVLLAARYRYRYQAEASRH